MINCPQCETEMAWNSDSDLENTNVIENQPSSLVCYKCNTIAVIYWGKDYES
jgi:hypothetical protein